MAAFRQAARGQGWLDRDELLKEVSLVLGYQRLGPKIEEALRGHLRAAIRRRIIEADGAQPGPCRNRNDGRLRASTNCAKSSAPSCGKARTYEREEVIHALARYLGFRPSSPTRSASRSSRPSTARSGKESSATREV